MTPSLPIDICTTYVWHLEFVDIPPRFCPLSHSAQTILLIGL